MGRKGGVSLREGKRIRAYPRACDLGDSIVPALRAEGPRGRQGPDVSLKRSTKVERKIDDPTTSGERLLGWGGGWRGVTREDCVWSLFVCVTQ